MMTSERIYTGIELGAFLEWAFEKELFKDFASISSSEQRQNHIQRLAEMEDRLDVVGIAQSLRLMDFEMDEVDIFLAEHCAYSTYGDLVREYQKRHQISGLKVEVRTFDDGTSYQSLERIHGHIGLTESDVEAMALMRDKTVQVFIDYCRRNPHLYLCYQECSNHAERDIQVTPEWIEFTALADCRKIGYIHPVNWAEIRQDADKVVLRIHYTTADMHPFSPDEVGDSFEAQKYCKLNNLE